MRPSILNSGGTIKDKSPGLIESTVDKHAPSFNARELFRLIYLIQKLKNPELMPDMSKFFKNLKDSRNKTSHLYAYLDLPLENHLQIVDELIPSSRKGVSRIDIMLAQHHIGYILGSSLENPEDIDSAIFQKAVKLLIGKKLIDKGPETDNPYPVWKFVRELIVQNKVSLLKDIIRANIILSKIDQLDSWVRGNQTDLGDSVRYPMPNQTMALPVTQARAEEIINSAPDNMLGKKEKQGIITGLKSVKDSDEKEHIIISYEALSIFGKSLLYKAVTSTSAAGAGTRFAPIVGFDLEYGTPLFHDAAKGVLMLAIDGGRGFIEMFLAQAGYINNYYGLVDNNRMPAIIYTSHMTDKDVKKELERIGYVQLSDKYSRYARYRHPKDPNYSEVTVVRLHKTNLLDIHNGDFLINIESEADWMQTHWPHAHDSALIDLITSGLAYEVSKEGKIYVDISNVDNRAGGTDPVILAMMELTGTALINETVLKPKGERGGGAPVILKAPCLKAIREGTLKEAT